MTTVLLMVLRLLGSDLAQARARRVSAWVRALARSTATSHPAAAGSARGPGNEEIASAPVSADRSASDSRAGLAGVNSHIAPTASADICGASQASRRAKASLPLTRASAAIALKRTIAIVVAAVVASATAR